MEANNSMIAFWIFNSLDRSWQASVAYVHEAKVKWDDLKERYSQGNAPRVHQIKTKLSNLKQRRHSIVDYYTCLKSLWDELDDYSEVSICTCAAATKLAE